MMGGRKSKEISRSVLTKIIEPRVEEILSMVSHEISNSGFKHLMSTGVVITGGASLLEGLPELAEFILEMPVRRGAPQGVGGLLDVEMDSQEGAQKAITMFHNHEMGNRALTVNVAKPKEDRAGGGGGFSRRPSGGGGGGKRY